MKVSSSRILVIAMSILIATSLYLMPNAIDAQASMDNVLTSQKKTVEPKSKWAVTSELMGLSVPQSIHSMYQNRTEKSTVVMDLLKLMSVVITVVQVYLMANKLWPRRHQKEVVESISVMGIVVGFILSGMFILIHALRLNMMALVNESMWLLFGVISFVVGAGLFLSRHSEGEHKQFIRMLKKEKYEIVNLLTTVVQKKHQKKIVGMLMQMAYVDQKMCEKEQRLITRFCNDWNIPLDQIEPPSVNQSVRQGLTQMKEMFADYLTLSPPEEQSRYVLDMLYALANIDDSFDKSEKMVLDEMERMLSISDQCQYYVLIVPQTPIAYQELVVERGVSQDAGGGFRQGPYLSQSVVENVGDYYRQKGCLCRIIL